MPPLCRRLGWGHSCGFWLLLFSLSVRPRCARQALLERLPRCAPVHAPPLVGTLSIVGDEELVQGRLHLVDGLEPGSLAFDSEVLIEQSTVEPFHDAVGLRAVDVRGAMLEVLELQEQLVGMAVGAPAELAPVV